jgi:hypothetical protein
MTKEIIIIALLLLVIYLYYQQKKQSKFFTSGDSGRTFVFGFEEEQLKESNQELKSHLDQALALQDANKTKMAEQTQEINNLKNRLNVYEGVGASSSGENEKLKAVLNERDELKRTNQNLELDKEKLTEDLNSILTE